MLPCALREQNCHIRAVPVMEIHEAVFFQMDGQAIGIERKVVRFLIEIGNPIYRYFFHALKMQRMSELSYYWIQSVMRVQDEIPNFVT